MSSSVAQAGPAVVVAVDVGKTAAAVLVTDAGRGRLLGPIEVSMTSPGVDQLIGKIRAVIPAVGLTRVGVEAAGHYHRPLLSGWPRDWQVVELNPAHVTEQRRVQTRTATKNQLLAQLDRCFPGLTLALPDVLGTKVGRLVAAHFADPHRLAVLGAARFVRFAAARNIRVCAAPAERLVAAARDALPSPEAAVARQVLAADLALLADLDAQVAAAEDQMAALLPLTPFAPLTTVPGWGVVRASNYGAAVGDLHRWPSHRQLYRSSGLSPAQYESAGRRRDGAISREGSVELRRALIDLGIGLWHSDPAAKRYGQALRVRGKKGGVIACALAHRANKIAYALVRDQVGYDPARWA